MSSSIKVEGTGSALVGPIMQAGDWAEVVAEAIAEDNPGSEVHIRDEGSYIHVHVAGQCRLTKDTLSRILGRPVRIGDVEPHMAFFAGQITTTTEEMTWRTQQGLARPVPQGATKR
jgi:toluene monooxygenase system protein D